MTDLDEWACGLMRGTFVLCTPGHLRYEVIDRGGPDYPLGEVEDALELAVEVGAATSVAGPPRQYSASTLTRDAALDRVRHARAGRAATVCLEAEVARLRAELAEAEAANERMCEAWDRMELQIRRNISLKESLTNPLGLEELVKYTVLYVLHLEAEGRARRS